MPLDDALFKAKQDGAFLWRVLGVSRNGNHEQCPICKKNNMRVSPDDKGIFLWQCMSGCGQGTVVDAIMKVDQKDLKTAMAEIRKSYATGASHFNRPSGNGRDNNDDEKAKKDEKDGEVQYSDLSKPRPEPVLDHDAAEDFISKSHEHLMSMSPDNKFVLKRGISPDVFVQYRIGFIENVRVKWYPGPGLGWNIPAAWVLPITGPVAKKDGGGDDDDPPKMELKGVKFHFEVRPKKADGSPCDAKALWAPFGLEPKHDKANNIKPVHSYYGLWPHPGTIVRPEPIINTDINWWIKQIPESGELRKKWNRVIEEQTIHVANELGKDFKALSAQELWMVAERSFDDMQNEIMRCISRRKPDEEDVESKAPFNIRDYFFIAPGELKALALLSEDLMATAITSGESWIPPPEMLQCFSGERVIIQYDNDPMRLDTQGRVRCPGREFATHLANALSRQGALEIMLTTFPITLEK